jgi:predicted PurR-regulated permease PerM
MKIYNKRKEDDMKRQREVIPVHSSWKIIGIVSIVIALLFFWPFLGIVVFAAVMAFLFYPSYRLLERHMPAVVAMCLTVLVSLIVLILPLIFILGLAIVQGFNFANQIAQTANLDESVPIQANIQIAVDQVNAILAPMSGGQVHVDQETVKTFISQTLPDLVKSLTNVIIGFASSIASLFTSGTIYLFMFAAFLMRGQSFLKVLREVSPFHPVITDVYMSRTGLMIKASMLGQLLIAFILAFFTACTFFIIDLGQYFFFWVIIFTILNMVPLGSAVVVWPIAIIAMMSGNVAGGLWVLVLYLFVICNIDNIMRPRLIPKNIQVVPAITSLAIFCGIYYFGFLGVVYGPVIAILLLTTLETYRTYKKSLDKAEVKEVVI